MRIKLLLSILLSSVVTSFGWAGSPSCESCTRSEVIRNVEDAVAQAHMTMNSNNQLIFSSERLADSLKRISNEFGIRSLTREEIIQIYSGVLLKSTAWGVYPGNQSQEALSELRAQGYDATALLNTTNELAAHPENTELTYEKLLHLEPALIKTLLLYGPVEAILILEDDDRYPDFINQLAVTSFSNSEEFLSYFPGRRLFESNNSFVIAKILESFAKIPVNKFSSYRICQVQTYIESLLSDERIEQTKGLLFLKQAALKSLQELPASDPDVICDADERMSLPQLIQKNKQRWQDVTLGKGANIQSQVSQGKGDQCSEAEINQFLKETATTYKKGQMALASIVDSVGCSITVIMRPASLTRQERRIKLPITPVQVEIKLMTGSGLRGNRKMTLPLEDLKKLL